MQTEAGDDPYASGMLRVVSVEPIFVVSDVPQAVAHYEQLGFNASQHDEGYAFAHRNELTIHLAGPGVDPERVGRGSIYMHVDDADALAEDGEVPEWTSSSPGTSSTANVKARTKIPTGTSFASDHPFGARAVWPSGRGNDCGLGQRAANTSANVDSRASSFLGQQCRNDSFEALVPLCKLVRGSSVDLGARTSGSLCPMRENDGAPLSLPLSQVVRGGLGSDKIYDCAPCQGCDP